MALVTLPSRFLPDKGLTWINWDYPRYAYPNLSVDYKMTGYDWYNREIRWSLVNTPTTVNPVTINEITGVIDWVPDFTEMFNDFEFTVRMTLDGTETVDKTFTTTVDLTRFIFCDWNLGVDENTDPLRGSEFAPYKSVRYAQSERAVDGEGMVFMVRGGTSNESYPYAAVGAVDSPTGGFTLNTADTPIMTRNYPNEEVVNDCQELGGSYVANCVYSIIYGLKAQNIAGTGVSMAIHQDAVGKLCEVDGIYEWAGINPSCFRFEGGSVLDSCIGANCMSATDAERTAPSGVNAQDFIGFIAASSIGDAYLIDCISNGLDELPVGSVTTPTCSFRTKSPASWDVTTDQGEYKTIFHRCVASNPLNSRSGQFQLNAGDSLRNSVIVYSDRPVASLAANAEPNRPSSHTYSLYSVSQNNLYCQIAGTSNGGIATETDRFLFYDDEFYAGTNFNPFVINITSGDLDGTYAGFDVQQTVFYAISDSDVKCSVQGTDYTFADFNTPSTGETDPIGGTGNTRIVQPNFVSKEAASLTTNGVGVRP